MIPNDADDRCTYVSMKDMALTPPRGCVALEASEDDNRIKILSFVSLIGEARSLLEAILSQNDKTHL
jgi:hypothetical protein